MVEAGAGAPDGSLAATALTVKEGVLSALPVIPGTLVIGAGDALEGVRSAAARSYRASNGELQAGQRF